jgi:hypothetical protein
MKNKKEENNKSASDLLSLIFQEQELRNNRDFAYAYATGALMAVIEANRAYGDDIQSVINRQCEMIEESINSLKLKKAA